MQLDGFDSDDGNRTKCQRHGVSIAEIEAALSVIDFVVDDRFDGEKRYGTVGRTGDGRHVFAVFTIRGSKLRPISVRYMHDEEVAQHEEAMAGAAQR